MSPFELEDSSVRYAATRIAMATRGRKEYFAGVSQDFAEIAAALARRGFFMSVAQG